MSAEHNATEHVLETINQKSFDLINAFDQDIAWSVQSVITPLYSKYPWLTYTVLGTPVANFIAATAVFILILLLRKFFTHIVLAVLHRLAQRTDTFYDDRIISALKGPLRFAFVIFALHLFFLLIYKETPFIRQILETLVVYTVFWTLLAVTDAMRELFYKATARFNPDLAKEMGSFILSIIKVLIAAVGLAAILTVWGINVTALIASLGLGGLAFALAAKDTAANLFGSFALLADKSMRIGEWVKIGDVEGVVEDIGMRTTKIRSFEKSLITVPNSIVANTSIENFSRRGVRRIKMHIGLTYDTTEAQMRAIVEDIRKMLEEHEGISKKETLLVRFDRFNDSSMDIFIYTFTATANWAKYLEIREDVHLKIMQIVERHGSAFAFPSQSVYVESLPENYTN
jgi:MscS family membrane protein